MKSKFILCFLFLCFLKTYSFNKIVISNPLKIIIACETKDDAKINAAKAFLQGDSSVKYISYCSNHAVFLIEIKGDQQSAKDLAEKLRKKINMTDENLYVKEYQFGTIESFCDSDNYRPDLKGK